MGDALASHSAGQYRSNKGRQSPEPQDVTKPDRFTARGAFQKMQGETGERRRGKNGEVTGEEREVKMKERREQRAEAEK